MWLWLAETEHARWKKINLAAKIHSLVDLGTYIIIESIDSKVQLLNRRARFLEHRYVS